MMMMFVQNVRGRIVTVIHSLLEHLLAQCPDHTKVLAGVAGLYQSLLFFRYLVFLFTFDLILDDGVAVECRGKSMISARKVLWL